MKKMIVSALMLAAMTAGTYTYAADTSAQASVVAPQDDNKTKIDPANLPDAVKATLGGDLYKDWKIATAWSVKAEPMYYTVELTNGEKTNVVNIGADGKVK